MRGIPAGEEVRRGFDPFPVLRRREVPPRAGSVRGMVEFRWKYGVGNRGLFHFLNLEDVPPEQFAPLTVRQMLHHPVHHRQATDSDVL